MVAKTEQSILWPIIYVICFIASFFMGRTVFGQEPQPAAVELPIPDPTRGLTVQFMGEENAISGDMKAQFRFSAGGGTSTPIVIVNSKNKITYINNDFLSHKLKMEYLQLKYVQAVDAKLSKKCIKRIKHEYIRLRRKELNEN